MTRRGKYNIDTLYNLWSYMCRGISIRSAIQFWFESIFNQYHGDNVIKKYRLMTSNIMQTNSVSSFYEYSIFGYVVWVSSIYSKRKLKL